MFVQLKTQLCRNTYSWRSSGVFLNYKNAMHRLRHFYNPKTKKLNCTILILYLQIDRANKLEALWPHKVAASFRKDFHWLEYKEDILWPSATKLKQI
jgi:hypothetical protein